MALASQQVRSPVKVPASAARGVPGGGRGGTGGGMGGSRPPRRKLSGTVFAAVALFVLVGGAAIYYAFFAGSRSGAAQADASKFIGPSASPGGAKPAPPPFEPVVLTMASDRSQTQQRPAPQTTAGTPRDSFLPTLVASTPHQPAQTPGSSPAASPSPAPSSSPGSTPAPAGTPAGITDPAAPGGATQPALSAAMTLMEEARRLQAQGQLVQARATLNRALFDSSAGPQDRAAIRAWMADINKSLVFSPAVAPGDTFASTYVVASGDNLEKIMRKQGLLPDKMFIARVNGMKDPNRLNIGQKLKVVRGPFHAVVSKSAFRMDVYAGDVPSFTSMGQSTLPDGAEPGWTYITSFPVGLGARDASGSGGTPIANFVVKAGSKLVNPHWANPRTGEKFDANDPKNPIGERWLGLEGIDPASQAFTGYGIHGTIEPESIGREMSMGCVRLNAADVEVVYEMLTPKISVVKIVP